MSDRARLEITELVSPERFPGSSEGRDERLLLAFVGPTKSGRFHVVSLGSDPKHEAAMIEQGLARSKDLASIKTFDMCADVRNFALIVADTCRNRVIAVRWIDGQTKVICGAGNMGPDAQGPLTEETEMREPASIAIYQPDLIDKRFLDLGSQRIVDVSLATGYPRTIIVADKKRNMLLRLIEMGKSAAMLSQANMSFLHPLLGDGMGGCSQTAKCPLCHRCCEAESGVTEWKLQAIFQNLWNRAFRSCLFSFARLDHIKSVHAEQSDDGVGNTLVLMCF